MEAVRVINAYSGRLTRGATIYPGVYALDDARLFGDETVEVMVAKRFAERIVIEALPEPPTAQKPIAVAEADDAWDDEADPVAMPDEADEPAGDEADEPYTDYESMSINDLKALMDARDIDIPETGTGRNGSVLKRDLIAELAAADLEDEAP